MQGEKKKKSKPYVKRGYQARPSKLFFFKSVYVIELMRFSFKGQNRLHDQKQKLSESYKLWRAKRYILFGSHTVTKFSLIQK